MLAGMPLSKAVKYVRDKKSDFRCVEVKYADQVDWFTSLICTQQVCYCSLTYSAECEALNQDAHWLTRYFLIL